MADIRVNSQELYQFANSLTNTSSELSENYTKLKKQIERVNETWQDEQNAKFMDNFLSEAEVIYKIADKMLSYAGFVARKARALEPYESS